MAGNLSNYAEEKILEHSVGKTSFTMPTVYLALYTTAPTDSTAGSEVTTSGTGYKRILVSGLSQGSVFGAAGSGQITNNGDKQNANGSDTTLTSGSGLISWSAATASWGTVTAVALVDGDTEGAGNIIWYGTLTSNKTVDSGDTFQFAPSSLTLSLD